MSDTNIATATATDTATATAGDAIATATTAAIVELKKTPKQYMLGVSYDDKQEIAEFAKLYVGPGVTKEYPMTEKEAVNLLLHVAKNRRFETVFPTVVIDDETGETDYTYDEDGNAISHLVDHWELESKRIFALRETKPAKIDFNDPAALRAQMAKIQAKLASLGLS